MTARYGDITVDFLQLLEISSEILVIHEKLHHLSRVVRKPAFCICENKDADQLRGNREADQRLCFRYMDSTIPLLPESEISSIKTYSLVVQPGLCGTWSETPKTGFLRTRLISDRISNTDPFLLTREKHSHQIVHSVTYITVSYLLTTFKQN